VGAFGGFLALSVIMWSKVWITGHPTSTMPCPCGDPALEMWWLQWLPWAIVHGHNPLYTNALYAGQGGVNALANTSALFPGLVVSPVTLLFGSVAGFNVAVTLAPAASAWCMFLFARKVTRFVPAQVAAGLVWGFSPFVFDNLSLGHLFVAVGCFPPLVALIVHDLLIEHRRRPLTNGVLAGVLLTLQFFTGSELLALSVLAGFAGVVVAVAVAPRLVWVQRRSLLHAGGAALVTAVALLAYPVWFELAGPRHIAGKIWPASVLPSGPLSGIVDPGAYVHQPSEVLAVAGYFGGQGPDGLYLGWALLAFIAVSAVFWRRRLLAWCALGTGVWAWILTQGADVHGWWWPWHLLARLPLISDAWPARLADLIDFSAALLLIISMDEWWKWIRARTRSEERSRARTPARPRGPRAHPAPDTGWRLSPSQATGAVVALVGIVAAVLVPMATTYTLPFTVQSARLPTWFAHDARRLPRGTRLVAIPYSPVALASETTAYQAEDILRLDLVGGYALVPAADGTSATLRPIRGTPRVLQELSESPELGDGEPATTPRTLAQVRMSLRQWGTQVFVIVPPQSTAVVEQYDATDAVRFVTAVYRRAPLEQDGAWVWYGTPRVGPTGVGHSS